MPDPFTPQVQRNYLDDILDQAYNDLDMERQRQESIIQSDNPDKVLSQQNKVEKQLENEIPEVQQAVRQKVYRPGYFDASRTAEDILPGKTEKDEEPYDDLVARFHEYNEKLPAYTKQEYDRISQEKLGSQRPTTSRMRMADYEGQPYTEEDIKNEAISSAKAMLSEEGLIKPKATGITALKETFTDWNKFGKKLPWIGGGGEAMEAFGIINAIRDVKDGTADEDDYRVLIESQMEMERDSDWTNMATEIFLTLPGYAIEFASTGSMATGARVATKAGVRKSLNWVLSKQGKKLIKEGSESFALRATQGVLGTTVGAVARTINPKTWNRTLGNATQQMIPDYELDQAQNGKIEVIADEFKDWGTALTEGALLTFTENLGEEFGEVFAFGGKEFRAYMKTNPESAVSGLIKSIIRKNPNVPVGKVMQSVRQAGIHSVPVEILEERVTDFLQSGIEGHEFHWPTPEEWLAEIVAIGGFAGGARGIGKIADSRTRKRQEKAKEKALSAIETGQLKQLTDDDITNFTRSLTKEEAMELGISQETGEIDPQSDLGKEMIRRNLEMEKFPETEKEFREAGARANIKQQQMEGKDFVGSLINKINEMTGGAVKVEREYLDRTLADEIADEELSEDRAKEILREHGIDENTDPKEIMITGRTSGFVVRLSTAGTEERLADEFVAVSEEMAEVSYNAESQNRDDFNEDTQESESWENEITEDRRKYHEATGEANTSESNKEWFSTMALRFATQGKVHESIGAKLKQIFNELIASAKLLLADSIRLQKHIKAGKVSDSLLKKLEEATDFKKVGEKVQQAKESKKDTSYRMSKKEGSDLVWKNTPIEKQPNLLTLTKYLTDRAKSISDELGVDLTKNTPESIDIISNVIAEEIQIEIGNKKNALGWYSIKMQNAIELLSQIHPEIMEDPNHNQVFKVALAITSNGTPVEDNLKIAMIAYEHWRDNGALPSTFKVGGQEGPSMATGFKLYNKIVDEFGTEFVHNFINTEFTVKEITDMGLPVNGELVSAKVMGAVIFGPKVGGGFLSNLNGHYQYLTMDRWFMRTMGRIRGDLKVDKDYSEQLKRFRTALRISPTKMKLYGVSKEDLKNDDKVIEVARKVLKEYAKPKSYKNSNKKKSFLPKTELNKASNTLVRTIDKIHEAPANGTERKYLREIMSQSVEKANIEGLTMADAQAIIWFPEKRFFSKFGVGSQRGKKETDYETEARQYVKTRIGSVQPIGISTASRRDTDIQPGKESDAKLQKEKPSYHLAPTFYSKAERVVTEQFPPTMKSQSVENFLLKNQVKPEEIQWLDLETLTRNKPKITKEELQDWIQANKIDVQDVMKSEVDVKFPADLTELPGDIKIRKGIGLEGWVAYWGDGSNMQGVAEETKDDAIREALEYVNDRRKMEFENESRKDAPAHSQYQLPGEKEDYRELLLTLPREMSPEEKLVRAVPGTGGEQYIESFTTGHYDEPNILAHVRFNTRKSTTGEQVLFIEELQSDWHTQGRKKGYKNPQGKDRELIEFLKIYSKPFNTITRSEERRFDELRTRLMDRYGIENDDAGIIIFRRILTKQEKGIPDAPFKNNGWVELIMKRMLRYASENNFDRIAWTTSNQQIDRWSDQIRQNVDQIHWQKKHWHDKEESYNEWVKGGMKGRFIMNQVVINGLKKKENVFNNTIPLEGETTINGQKVTLEGLLGKQMATQIRNSDKPTGIIEGDNLTIGGQGFKTVYDFAIKKILNKMGNQNKWGAKVDQVGLDTTISGVGGIGRDAEDFGMVGVEIQTTQPSIRVTRKMKESALKGQPTFRASKMTSTEDVLDSPSFKKWFKGSKVVDENGKPLVVYHGSVFYIESFNTPSYFTSDPRYAEGIADELVEEMYEEGDDWNPSQRIYPVYLNINKPKIIEEFDTSTIDVTDISNEDIKNLKSEGYDGIISGETYVVFEPTQIKSVFNKGTFNPHDPRISFHMAPKNLVTPLAKIYQEQKGTKKSYTKKNFENDLLRLGYPDDTVKTAMDLFGIIRIKQIETDDPTPIEKELKKIQDLHITRSNLKTRIKRAYTLGAVEKEKEIKKLQKIITKYARDNMPIGEYKKSEVTGLLAKVRDAKRAQQLAPALERIDRVIDKVQKRSALSKWNKTVKKKAKVKKVSGIVRGTVGPDVQDIVNDIRGKKKGDGIMDLSPADVEHKIELMSEIMEASETGEPTDAQAQELNLLLTYGAMKHKTPEEITYATKKFDKLVTDGRMQVIEEQQAYKERMAEEIAGMLDVITGGAGSQTQAGAQRLGLNKEGKIEEWKEFFSTLDSDQQSLEYIFDKLSRLDKTSGPLESAINKYFMPRIRQARLAEYNGLVEMQTLLKEKAEKIFKVKGRKLTARLNDNTIGELRVDHLNGIEGEPIFSILSHNQAIKKWMELMDPTLVNTFEKTGWDVEKAKRQIEEQLPKDMLEWGKWQLFEFYPMYYHRVNETFRKRFYVNMPFNSFYSPISRRIGAKADEGDDTLNKSKSPMGSMSTAGSLKGRVSNVEELAWIDGDTTIMKHITEMEHFIHYTELMRELRTVFTNRDISRSIDDFHGKGISRILNKFLDDIARGGVDRANNLMWMDKLRANFSRAVIGANPVVYMKQLASIPAYMADIPILDWNKEFIKLFNPIEIRKMYRTLTKSEMLKMRYDKGFERDMVLALQNVKPGKMITGSNLFNNAMYAFTKMGDKQAIFVGGWPVYKYHLKQALKAGKSKEEAESIAMRKFEEASLRSQQASDVEDLGDFARRGSAYKLFTMFMTSPNQYYRMVAGGYRNLYYKRGSKSENWRRVFIGQFLLPTLFQFISNGFQWDDKDQAMSVLLFPFSGLLFWGQGFEYLIRSAFNKAYPMGPVAIMTFIQDWGKSLKRMFNGKDLTPEDTLKIIDSFIDGVSKVGGVPYGPATRTAKGIIKVAKGEAQHPIREAIGFKFKGKKKKKKKKKAKVAQPMFLQ